MAKERLDKLIASTGRWSRREVKTLVREGRVLVDGRIAGSAEEKYDAESCRIAVNGEELLLRRYTYVMLHKPAGVLSATEDGRGRTVLDLLTPELLKIGVFPVGRLDKDTIRVELLEHLRQSLAEITYQRAANAALAHFGDFNAGVLQKAAVNGNLAELVFDEDELFALKSFGDQLADQRGFACAEEAGKNIDFRHILMPFRNNLRFAFLVRPRSFAVLTTCF